MFELSTYLSPTRDLAALLLLLLYLPALGWFMHPLIYGDRVSGDPQGINELPPTVAERRALLAQEGENGPTLQKLKQLAQRRTATPIPPMLVDLLQRAGRTDRAERVLLARAVMQQLAMGGLLGLILGLIATVPVVGLVVGASGGSLYPIIELYRAAKARDLEFAAAIAALIPALRATLERGLDIETSLQELRARAGHISQANLILDIIITCIESARDNRTGLLSVIRESSSAVGNPEYRKLCALLALTAQHGAGWRASLTALEEQVTSMCTLGYRIRADDVAKIDRRRFFEEKRR